MAYCRVCKGEHRPHARRRKSADRAERAYVRQEDRAYASASGRTYAEKQWNVDRAGRKIHRDRHGDYYVSRNGTHVYKSGQLRNRGSERER